MMKPLSKYPKKMQHKVLKSAGALASVAAGGKFAGTERKITLAKWGALYLESDVIGVQSHNTAQAKRRDLLSFMGWYWNANGHLVIKEWLPRDTRGFLDHLEKQGLAPTTCNRIMATLRHFARWAHDQLKSPFVGGLPTRGIKDFPVGEPTAKKLETREVNRLFKAADKLTFTDTRKNARPKRNRAILALLYYTGLRVSELCSLKISQYDGSHLVNVRRKGATRTRKMYVAKNCRVHLDEYLETERRKDDPKNLSEWLVLASGSVGMINRTTVWRVLERLSREATAHTKDDLKIHPHRLRHTFGFEVWKRTGSDAETAALLGTSIAQVGRYARYSEQEREDILDDL